MLTGVKCVSRNFFCFPWAWDTGHSPEDSETVSGVTQEAEDENVHVSGVPTDKESVIGPARLLGEE